MLSVVFGAAADSLSCLSPLPIVTSTIDKHSYFCISLNPALPRYNCLFRAKYLSRRLSTLPLATSTRATTFSSSSSDSDHEGARPARQPVTAMDRSLDQWDEISPLLRFLVVIGVVETLATIFYFCVTLWCLARHKRTIDDENVGGIATPISPVTALIHSPHVSTDSYQNQRITRYLRRQTSSIGR